MKEARTELRDAANYYNRQHEGLGREFRDEVQNAFTKIRQWPNAWPVVEEHYRHYKTARFPYGVVYRLDSKVIVVVAVAHLHRNPGYWRSRIEGDQKK